MRSAPGVQPARANTSTVVSTAARQALIGGGVDRLRTVFTSVVARRVWPFMPRRKRGCQRLHDQCRRAIPHNERGCDCLIKWFWPTFRESWAAAVVGGTRVGRVWWSRGVAGEGCCRVMLPHLSMVVIDRIDQVDGRVVISARYRARASRCRRCGRVSTRVHSRYRRHLADLPVSRRPVEVMVTVRRFFCGTASAAVRARSRHLADLPVSRRPVEVMVTVRRFFCDSVRCSTGTFANRCPD